MDVEDVIAEQRWLLGVSVVLCQDVVEQTLTPGEVVGASCQTSADLHNPFVRQKLQTVHRSGHPLVSPEGREE